MSGVRFESCDPEKPPASELLSEMREELNALYATSNRLDNPPLHGDELRPPLGVYLVGWEGTDAVAGGGVRQLEPGLAEIKRMYIRPPARARGVATALLSALEEAARTLGCAAVRLDTGPKQVHALRLYRQAGYAEIPCYNDNPFASFWGEKRLT